MKFFSRYDWDSFNCSFTSDFGNWTGEELQRRFDAFEVYMVLSDFNRTESTLDGNVLVTFSVKPYFDSKAGKFISPENIVQIKFDFKNGIIGFSTQFNIYLFHITDVSKIISFIDELVDLYSTNKYIVGVDYAK